ncbi:TPA: lysozyme [Yersinia enterocolitica]|nr:lysozyme [Yersinia enterocolitica]HDL7425692.1 lysozyme [Yersinia enterocolitica]
MSPALRNKIIGVSAAGALAIAAVLVPSLEGVEYKPYQDIGGVWTVCNGITGPDVVIGKTYTEADCANLLQKHLKPYAKSVERSVRVPASEYQKAALISFSFNVGIYAFEHSSLLRYLNEGQSKKACDALRQWVYVNKKKIPGLMNRREIEREICNW